MDDAALHSAIREAFVAVAPAATWRGVHTGWHALDLVALAEVVHQSLPAVVVIHGGLGAGGLPLFVGDLLDTNGRGKVYAVEKMSRERFRTMPTHRRVAWQSTALAPYERLAAAEPVLVVAEVTPTAAPTYGSYLVMPKGCDPPGYPGYLADPSPDPLGMSARTWFLRVRT